MGLIGIDGLETAGGKSGDHFECSVSEACSDIAAVIFCHADNHKRPDKYEDGDKDHEFEVTKHFEFSS